ncbi:MAG: hypothetical protein LH616_15400 [Ilumatobacteraceae bacterium]|nr:hypothetical protein [Ilumatobacteraceae bacterium]
MKRIFGLVVALAATVGLGASVASAVYPDNPPGATVNNGTPDPGAQITVTFSNFCPNDTLTITLGSTVVGSVQADANGVATFTGPAPTAAGIYTISGTGTTCPTVFASSSITVLAAAGGIPATGSGSTSAGLELGGLAVAAGAGMVGIAAIRRRRPALA